MDELATAMSELAADPDEQDPVASTVTTTHLQVTCDLDCLMCGRNAGTAVRIDQGPVLWHRLCLPVVALELPVNIRCEACGGSVILTDVETKLIRIESSQSLFDRPRRGRPPKWLVNQRAQERLEAAVRLAS